MPEKSNDPLNFWQELKRRKVSRVITVYAATAFVILELVDIVSPALGLPSWTMALVIVLLCIGFIVSTILSWVYDITPEGVKKTKPVSKQTAQITEKSSSTLGWKIATYTSLVVIVGLLLINIFGREKKYEEVEKSIAILPFKYLSDEPDKQYLADGMMDAILLHLSKISDLKVRSRTSVEQYRNTEKTITEIGSELGVGYLLEGSFQKSGDNVRLIIQLIRTNTDDHIWSNEYDRKWSDIFSVQSEVAETVARELGIIIKPEEKDHIEKTPTNDLQAYDYYLLGEHFRSKRTKDDLLRASNYFEKAIESDPDFTLAYTRLARVYGLLAFYSSILPEEAYSSSLQLATKALELDSMFAEAFVVKGIVDLFYNFDFISAEKNYERALELEPKNLEALASMAELMQFKGEFLEILKFDQQAMEIDPSYPVRDGLYWNHLYFAGYKDSSFVHLLKLTERYPVCNLYLGIMYLREGEYEKALDRLERLLSDFSPIWITQLGLAYSKSNALNETQRMLDTLERRAETEFVPFSMRGALLSELGRNKEALEYLKQGYDHREEFILLLMNIDTISYSSVRSDSCFIDIIGKIKL